MPLARATASSYESTRNRPATGPNTSCDHIAISGVRSATTVGGYHQPGPVQALPPAEHRAPLRHRVPYLCVHVVADLLESERPDVGIVGHRVTDLQRRHVGHEGLG